MAWRAIHDTVGRSESLAALTDTAERLYWRLLSHSDSHGRIAGSPPKTRAQCFPLIDWTPEQVGEALAQIEQVGRIWIYEENETWVIQIVDFETNQPRDLLRKRGSSRLPESQTLKSGHRTDKGRTLYKLPANEGHAGTRADQSGPRAGKSRGEENRKELTAAANEVHYQHEPAAADIEELLQTLDNLGLNGHTRNLALTDPARAQAWINLAATAADTNPAGYIRHGLESGNWPSPRRQGSDAGKTRASAGPDYEAKALELFERTGDRERVADWLAGLTRLSPPERDRILVAVAGSGSVDDDEPDLAAA